MSTLATVDPTSAKAPILTQGDISPAVMMEFENAALDFFNSKSVPAEKQVTMFIPGIKDLRIRDWITAERARIVALPFADFMSEMCLNYLPPNWEDLLRGTPSVFDDPILRNHLEAHLDDELKAKLRHSEARKDKVLKSWVVSVRLLDEARAVETKCQRELIEETLQRQAKKQNTNSGPSHRSNSSQSNTTSSTSSSYVRLPALTDTEHTLLNEHDGCTKCCRFFAGHRSQSCPNGFPAGKGYKTLTVTDAMTAKKAKAVAKPITKAVAATTASIETVNSDDEISATAALLPNSPGEYNSDSDEDWDVSRRDVSPPLRCKHLVWHCQIHSLIEDFPVKTRVLIDNGAHLILIRPDLVDRLGLKKHKLHKPEIVDVAFSNQKKETVLYYYVNLSLTSLDASWTSRSVKAIVTPDLCAPVILGLPWLVHNSIVTDHSARTCIDKLKSYDLLNPPPH